MGVSHLKSNNFVIFQANCDDLPGPTYYILMVECNCDKMQSKILSLLIVEKCETKKKIIVKQQCSEFTMSYHAYGIRSLSYSTTSTRLAKSQMKS